MPGQFSKKRPGRWILALLLIPLLLAACDAGTATTAGTTTTSPTSSTIQATMAPVVSTAAATTQAAPSTAPADQATTTLNTGEVDGYIKQMMDTYEVPGVAVALIQDGKIIYQKGYGLRDIKSNSPVTENTLFGIGSVTKSFTALAVAQLVDAGKLDLDTPVVKYLPDFKLSDPDATQKLTLRQLLSHSSGLPRFDDWITNSGRSRTQVLADMAKIPMTAEPSKYWQYCNQNFVVAGAVVEKVSGQTWEDYTQEHIFNPLGMKSANFDVSTTQQASDYASPYALNVLTGNQPLYFFSGLKSIGPAGEINANVQDMAKYALFQLGDGTQNEQKLLSQTLLDEMHRQQIALPASYNDDADTGTPVTANHGYGFGWFTEDFEPYKVVQHSGNVSGFTANVTLVPSARDGVGILTNGNDANLFVGAASLQLVEMLTGQKTGQDISEAVSKHFNMVGAVQHRANIEAARTYKADPASFQTWVGDYDGLLGRFSVAATNGKLFITQKGRSNIELLPYKAGGFLANSYSLNGIEFTFQAGANGKMTVLEAGREIAHAFDGDAKAKTVADPKAQFTVSLPDGFTAQPQGNMLKIQAQKPDALVWLTAAGVQTDDMRSSAKTTVKNVLDASFNLDPTDIRPVSTLNGLTWTQYLYKLPNNQTLAVEAARQNLTYYFVIFQAKEADMAALTPKLQSLVASFEIFQ